ncbi:MAG: transcriptional regulator [Methanosarcinaceae archaeon]|nr:transcriptional regulator [Methanosarcinaceae archaeon]
MINSSIHHISENENVIIQLLQTIGVPRIEAISIVCLLNGEELTSQDIELKMGLRQSEVSVAMSSLYERGWIEQRSEKTTMDRGRPTKYYHLKVALQHIVQDHETQILERNREQIDIIDRLRELCRGDEMSGFNTSEPVSSYHDEDLKDQS